MHITSNEELSATSDVASGCWVKVTDEPLKMCDFTTESLVDYFVYSRETDGLQRQDWKSLNAGGFKLFAEGHVQDVYINTRDDDCKVKAVCLPEMKKDHLYSVFLTIGITSCNVKKAECSCPAGHGPLGSCKHIAALCFCLEDFVKSRRAILDAGEEACTSMLQKWNQPRKRRLDSKKAEDISFRCPVPAYADKENKRSERKAYDPRPLSMRKTSPDDLEEFKKQLQELPTGSAFLHLLCKPSITAATPTATINLPLLPRSVQCRVRDKLFKMPLPPTLECLQELGKEFIDAITPSSEQTINVEQKTRMQANCARWHEEHFCRLTASTFGTVMKRKSNHQKLAQYLLERKMVPSTVRAIRWGREHEDVVFDIYSSEMNKHHPHLTLHKSGMYIGEPGYLGASPDGVLVNDTNTICGIIEIKCPYSAAKLTVKEACSLCNDFYCYLDDNSELNLKENHAYYYQVQGTMAITKADFCDFIIWTPKSMEIICINFNSHVWETILPVLKNFYMQYMLPCILY